MSNWPFVFLAVLLGLMWGGIVFIYTNTGQHERLHCVRWVTHPTVLACDNGHSYVVQGGKLIDLGLSSGTPYLPKR